MPGEGGQCPICKKGRCVQNGTIAEGRKRTTMRCWPRPLACRPSAIRRETNPRRHFFGRAALRGDDPMMTMAFSSVCSLFPPFPRPLFLFPFRPKSHFICFPRWRLSYWVVASSPFCREQNTKLPIGPPLSFFSSFIVPHTLGSVASEEDSHLQRAALTHFFYGRLRLYAAIDNNKFSVQ